jgi:hypothetical protein
MRWVVLVVVAGCSYQPSRVAGDDSPDGGEGDATATGDAAVDSATPPAAPFALSGSHWFLPCTAGTNGNPNSHACLCGTDSRSRTVGGQAGESWRVTVRIRGVMERMGYTGGVASGTAANGWYVGGNPGDGGNNFYKLTVSDPAAHYFINSGSTAQNNSWPFDYEATFDVAAGATLTFDSNGQDTIQWEGVDTNDVPISIPGIINPPQPYNGQFAQLDVLAAEPI